MSISLNLSEGLGGFVSLQRGSVQAFIDANKALAAGLQEMSKELMAVTQSSIETAASTGTRFAQVKTVQELVNLQIESAKTGYDSFVVNSTKLSELGKQVANATFAPLAARVGAVTAKVEEAVK